MSAPAKRHNPSGRAHQPSYWAVVPAAGVGSRMGAGVPKQYLRLAGLTVIEHTLHRLLQLPCIDAIVVALNSDDDRWRQLPVFADSRIEVTEGGAERADSVANALRFLSDRASPDDWVLVHDAARPCVRHADLQKLVSTLRDSPVGGILGAPVHDTLKSVTGDGAIEATRERAGLWRAFTPQMFRYQLLRQALTDAAAQGIRVTDEASALEAAGYVPHMVEGHSDNIKITTADDLHLAELLLGGAGQREG